MNEKGFRGVVGHGDAVAALQNSIRSGRVPHAYLFAGEEGAGKHFLATTFAAALLCKEGGTEPCMRCASCRRVLAGTWPDLLEVVHEKPDLISVKEVREQVVATVGKRPFDSKYKVYIIDDAEKMNPQAQNALLKTIEEPPDYAILLLLANSPEALLPTIHSRCVRVDVRGVPNAKLVEHLVQDLNVPPKDAEVAAAFAQGNIGRAREIAGGGAFAEHAARVLGLARKARELPIAKLASETEAFLKEEIAFGEILDILLLWYRDVLLYKSTGDMEKVVFRRTPEEMAALRTEAALLSYEDLGRIFEAIEHAAAAERANVSASFALELLFTEIAG